MEVTISVSPFYLRNRIMTLVARAINRTLVHAEGEKKYIFDQIISQYDNLVSRICLGYSRSKEEYEDLRQDVYVNVWMGLDRFRGDASTKTWLYRVTLNTCVSTIRKKSHYGQMVDLAEVADVGDDSEQTRSRIKELYQSINCLMPIDKAIVMLWLDGLNYEEIAQTIGMSRNAIATRLHRAKQKLKTYGR